MLPFLLSFTYLPSLYCIIEFKLYFDYKFRLISERTVEENILKKAQQKRLLGNIAIEGGNFNTAYLKQESVQELFNTESVNIFGSVELTKKNDISSGDQITIDVPQPNNAYEQVRFT